MKCPALPSWSVLVLLSATCAACAIEGPVNAAPSRVDAGLVRPQAGISGQTGAGAAAEGGTSSTAGLTPEQILSSGCATSRELSTLLPSNLLFVVDRSGSMACNPPPTTSSAQCELDEKQAVPTESSKWQLTTKALLTAIRALPDTSYVGVSYFSNDSQCGVSATPTVALSPRTQGMISTIATSLTGIKPSGSTPLVGAALLAYQYMHQAALHGDIVGNRYVVLITDGQQSDLCSDAKYCKTAEECSQLLVAQTAIAAGEGVNIRTFVLGVPGSEVGRAVLSRLAQAGGTALAGCTPEQSNCHFDVTQDTDLEAALEQALTSITRQTLTCELNLPSVDGGTPDLTRFNVVWTPREGAARVIPWDQNRPCDGGADGWRYDEQAKVIRLCGNACTAVRADVGGSIDVVLGCPVIGPD